MYQCPSSCTISSCVTFPNIGDGDRRRTLAAQDETSQQASQVGRTLLKSSRPRFRGPAPRTSTNETTLARAIRYWRGHDVNGDCVIDATEFGQFLNWRFGTGTPRSLRKAMFEQVDRNNDGRITPEELDGELVAHKCK